MCVILILFVLSLFLVHNLVTFMSVIEFIKSDMPDKPCQHYQDLLQFRTESCLHTIEAPKEFCGLFCAAPLRNTIIARSRDMTRHIRFKLQVISEKFDDRMKQDRDRRQIMELRRIIRRLITMLQIDRDTHSSNFHHGGHGDKIV